MKSITIGMAAWLLAGFGLLTLMWRYETEAGPKGRSADTWPGTICRTQGRPTLVLALHPRCPCSRASVEELAAILSAAPGPLSVHVALYHPRGENEAWSRTGLRESVSRLSGVTVHTDGGGEEAERFGVATSGHALLYDSRGRLTFSGGITGARGHQGDNPGRRAIIAFLTTGHVPVATTPVFGCPIFKDGEANP